jgi:ribose 5-phosphate isomerase B
MKVYLGSDHRGFKLKEKLKDWLKKWNYDFEDFGAYELDPRDDYTIYAEKVGSIVAEEKGRRGILLCGSGVGVDITANKLDGVRASVGKNPKQVKKGRSDDDMNVLVIAADYTDAKEAREMAKAFLETKFSAKARFKRRLRDIKRIETNN